MWGRKMGEEKGDRADIGGRKRGIVSPGTEHTVIWPLRVPRGEVVLYLDEVDIHLNPKIGPVWRPAGKQKYVDTPGCNQKRYLAGAFNPRTGKLTWGRRGPEKQPLVPRPPSQARDQDLPEIGRASWKERVEITLGRKY